MLQSIVLEPELNTKDYQRKMSDVVTPHSYIVRSTVYVITLTRLMVLGQRSPCRSLELEQECS